MKKCVGRSNLGVTFGEATEQGLRKTMEDTCGIYPEFMTLSCIEVGGCTAPSCRYASVKSPVHYFGVFDGHGGSQDVTRSYIETILFYLGSVTCVRH
ncbi:hypothetical protein Q3G72_001014 [Acer saccharum]|nr:hypothetical protein Q3G72_001014 [Acer saccharum]